MLILTHGFILPAGLRCGLAQRTQLERLCRYITRPAPPASNPTADQAHAHPSSARMSWARLLKRVFNIDIEHCPNCGGALKIIAAIVDPPVIAKILTHLKLPAQAPPRSPAPRLDLFDLSHAA